MVPSLRRAVLNSQNAYSSYAMLPKEISDSPHTRAKAQSCRDSTVHRRIAYLGLAANKSFSRTLSLQNRRRNLGLLHCFDPFYGKYATTIKQQSCHYRFAKTPEKLVAAAGEILLTGSTTFSSTVQAMHSHLPDGCSGTQKHSIY